MFILWIQYILHFILYAQVNCENAICLDDDDDVKKTAVSTVVEFDVCNYFLLIFKEVNWPKSIVLLII